MMKKTNNITVGLFGTCGRSTWRNSFIQKYKDLNISFFNPQVEEWDPSMAAIEAEHLAEDEIILFPVTSETYGTGSLAETGFSILQAINLEKNREFILLIEPVPAEELKENMELYKESCRARALVIQHLKKLKLKNVYVVNNMEDMLNISIELVKVCELKQNLSKFNLGV